MLIFLFFLFLFMIFQTIVKSNFIYTMVFIGITIFPILIVLSFALLKSEQKRIVIQTLKKIFLVIRSMSLIFLLVLFLMSPFFYDGVTDEIIKKIIIYFFYFTIFILDWLVVNYFATASLSLRKTIMTFIESLTEFFKNNFMISLLTLISSLFTIQMNEDLFIGVVGAYLFFFFSEINVFYENNKAQKSTYEKGDRVLQIVINIVLAIIFADFEQFLFF